MGGFEITQFQRVVENLLADRLYHICSVYWLVCPNTFMCAFE
jgi:hypothetical protein